MTWKTEKYFLAKLTFLNRADASDTLDFWVGTRTLPKGQAWSGSPWIYGVILDLNGFGQSMGEVIPKVGTGSISLNTTRGSYEHHKSVVDLLEKYTILKQRVEIYSFSKQPEKVGSIADRELEFVGEVSSLSYSPSSKNLSLEVQTIEILSDTPLRRITVDFAPDAPSRSIGRYLPIVFGQAQVPAYPMKTFFGFENSYALCSRWTLLLDTFRSGAINKYFYQQQGEYVEVVIDNSNTGYDPSPGQLERYVYNTTNLAAEQGHFDWQRDLDGSENRIITAAYFTRNLTVGGGDSVTANPSFTIEVYQESTSGENPVSNSPTASAVIVGDSDTYDTADSSGLPANEMFAGDKYRARMPFDRPFALTNNRTFLVQRVADDRTFAAGADGWRPFFGAFWDIALLGSNFFSFRREQNIARSSRDWIKKFDGTLGGAFGYFYNLLNCVSREVLNETPALDAPIDALVVSLSQITDFFIEKQAGYIPGSFDPSTIVRTRKALAGQPSALDISQLNLICEVEGVRDDSSGTITGTPDQVITRADNAIKLLWYLMRGSLSDLDTTTYTPENYIGDISGASEGRRSYRQIISDILYNTSSRLIPRRDGKLALWAYGVSQTPTKFIDEADCRFEGWTEDAGESLVNRVEFAFDRLAIPLNVEDLQTRSSSNHAQTYTTQDNESINFFSLRDLSEGAITLDWIRDQSQASKLARFILETYSAGSIYVTFTVPFWKEDYREIEVYDIIGLNHIDIPSEFGSQSSNIARDREVGSDTPYDEGFPFRQSKTVFLRILSRSPRLTTNADEASITFLGKLMRDREFK